MLSGAGMFLVVGGDSEIGGAASAKLRARHHVVTTTRRPGGSGGERIVLDLAGDLSAWEPPAGVTAACICAAVARLADCAADPAGSARINVSGLSDAAAAWRSTAGAPPWATGSAEATWLRKAKATAAMAAGIVFSIFMVSHPSLLSWLLMNKVG